MIRNSDQRVDSYRRSGVLFAFLVVACVALAIGYAWRASVQRAALFQDESLPEIGSLADLNLTVDQPQEEAVSDDLQLMSVTEGPNELANGRDIDEVVTPDVVSDSLSGTTAAGSEVSVPEHAVFIRHTGLDASYGIMSALRLTASDTSSASRAGRFCTERLRRVPRQDTMLP